MADGASERAVRPLAANIDRTSNIEHRREEKLEAALCRRVGRVSEELEARWPLGSGPRDVAAYLKALRRWMRLRQALEQVLIAGGVL